MSKLEELVIIGNRTGQAVAKGVIDILREGSAKSIKNHKPVQPNIKHFPSGEIYVQLMGNVRNRNVHVISGSYMPGDYYLRRAIVGSDMDQETKIELIENKVHSIETQLRETTKLCDALRNAHCGKISIYPLVFPDARQDRKNAPRVSISAALTMNQLVESALPRDVSIGLIDIHSEQIQGHVTCPVDHIQMRGFLLMYLRYLAGDLSNMVVVSPDEGAMKGAAATAEELDLPMAIHNKLRTSHDSVKKGELVGADVEGKVCFMLDDMYDKGTTACLAAQACYEHGATEVYLLATHGIASTIVKRDKETGEFQRFVFAEDTFRASGIKVITTTTVGRTPQYYREHSDWLMTPIMVDQAIADLIECNESDNKSHGNKLKGYIQEGAHADPKKIERYLLKL